MKATELIKMARKCGERSTDCERDCKFFNCYYCTTELAKELANKLEMAVSDISKNCGNCIHKSNDYRQLPCSICEALEFSKWEWQGDAE